MGVSLGLSLLSPLRPEIGNGEPHIELLGNALTFERVLQRPTPNREHTPVGLKFK